MALFRSFGSRHICHVPFLFETTTIKLIHSVGLVTGAVMSCWTISPSASLAQLPVHARVHVESQGLAECGRYLQVDLLLHQVLQGSPWLVALQKHSWKQLMNGWFLSLWLDLEGLSHHCPNMSQFSCQGRPFIPIMNVHQLTVKSSNVVTAASVGKTSSSSFRASFCFSVFLHLVVWHLAAKWFGFKHLLQILP